MPICEEIYNVLYEGKSPLEALKDLMARDKKREDDSGEESWVG
jgi:glycerol-3-phosphate dehydrogenase (NAD(P)+)